MLKPSPLLVSVAVLLIITLACSTPGIATPDPNAINTMVAQTFVAAVSQTAQAIIPVTGQESPTSTFTPKPPTFTPTATLSPTPIFTSTPLIPLISVSVATNCRVGPGKIYDRVGALLVGETAEVVGRDLNGTYWYIGNPDGNTEFCWLWGEYATLSGNTLVLPIYTPPPTPTPAPALEAVYHSVESCTNWWINLTLHNTGGLAFRSVSIRFRDLVTNTIVSSSADGFTNLNGCNASNTKDVLSPGDKRVVSGPAFIYDPTGHKIRATITLCSEAGINGTCVTNQITFTP